MAHKTEAATKSGESVEGQGVSPSLTHTFNLRTAKAMFCGIFGRTFATVTKQNKNRPPSPIYSPESPRLQRKRDRSGFPRRTAPAIHLCLHMIQDISQGMFYHSAPAHVTHLWEERETGMRRWEQPQQEAAKTLRGHRGRYSQGGKWDPLEDTWSKVQS